MSETDLQTLRKRLLDYYTTEEAETWLHAPQKLLNGAKAIDNIPEGHRLLDQLDASVYI